MSSTSFHRTQELAAVAEPAHYSVVFVEIAWAVCQPHEDCSLRHSYIGKVVLAATIDADKAAVARAPARHAAKASCFLL